MVTVIQAYRFALDPTAGLYSALRSHCGARRYAFDWGLGRIAALHSGVANARRDGLHKLTTGLVRTRGAVVIEDLNVAGMLRIRRLARHIAGVGMAELRRQVEYKARWAGVRVHVADRWYPSSKTSSPSCGATRTSPLETRVRPAPPGPGQRRRRKATTART